MNKIITLIFVSITLFAGAQEIVDSSKVWSILTGYCHPDNTIYNTEYFKFAGDTVIEGKNYKKVNISEDEFHEEWFFYGTFVREESGRVYYREYTGEEGLIYDFNLELGDTVTINNPRVAAPVTLTLVEIDSVQTSDGYRDRWKLTSEEHETPEYWIRGIGSTAGVINSTSNVFGGLCGLHILLCEEEDGETVYHNPDYELCYYELLDDVPEQEQESLAISYNHSDKLIRLTFVTDENRRVNITGVNGQITKEMKTTGDKITFSLAGYPYGLYVITVFSANKKPLSKKLIVY